MIVAIVFNGSLIHKSQLGFTDKSQNPLYFPLEKGENKKFCSLTFARGGLGRGYKTKENLKCRILF